MTDQTTTPAQPKAVISSAELGTTPHAVRWAQRELKHCFGMQYSRWHWTKNAVETVCGTRIQLIADGPAMLPETDERMGKVTCRRCLRLLPNSEIGG
jgi:hypothetical protein